MGDKKKPAREFKLGRIKACIWANETENHDLWYNVTVTRLYKNGTAWKDSTSFRRDDLPVVIKAVDMAYEWIWRTQLVREGRDQEVSEVTTEKQAEAAS